MVIREIEVRDIMTKTNLPVSDFAVNPYVGCTHACKYCYAKFRKPNAKLKNLSNFKCFRRHESAA